MTRVKGDPAAPGDGRLPPVAYNATLGTQILGDIEFGRGGNPSGTSASWRHMLAMHTSCLFEGVRVRAMFGEKRKANYQTAPPLPNLRMTT